jgi:hypothetical protein
MTEQKFNEDKMELYIMLIEKVYDVVEEDVNVNNYEEKALDANLYHKYENYEPCVHPVAYSPSVLFYLKATDLYSNKWHKDVSGNPALLNFWFDFLDSDHELQKFSCHAIGNRPKGVNDNQVKAIYFRETPTVVFVKSNDEKEKRSKLGYTTIQIPDEYEAMFDISSQGKSAKAAVDNLLYQHACVAEQISISVLPIYHLEPNTRIFIRNDESGINGEYILVRYNITLGTNGNMSITAAKAVDKLY